MISARECVEVEVDEAGTEEVFVDTGLQLSVPSALIDAVAERAGPGDVRAAALAPHAVAEAMCELGPASRAAIERQAVRRVREQLAIWNITAAETLYRLGLAPRPVSVFRVLRPALVPRQRRRVRPARRARRSRAPARPRRAGDGPARAGSRRSPNALPMVRGLGGAAASLARARRTVFR